LAVRRFVGRNADRLPLGNLFRGGEKFRPAFSQRSDAVKVRGFTNDFASPILKAIVPLRMFDDDFKVLR
jgi:hypothetical protein